ncbi:MAG: hypothetical protein AB7F35_06510 [Acetobacteraceae bacterium]
MSDRQGRRPNPRPYRPELLDALDKCEIDVRALASRWHDSLPADVRAELHRIANALLDILLRAGRRQ